MDIPKLKPKMKTEFKGVTGGGINKFTELSDCPNSLSGQSLKNVRVKSDESGLEFGAGSGAYDEFIELTDTPSSYTSNDNALVAVNSSANGLEFTYSPLLTGINVKDPAQPYYLNVIPYPNSITANRSLAIDVDDSNRTLTLGGNLTVSGTYAINQSVAEQSQPWFDKLDLNIETTGDVCTIAVVDGYGTAMGPQTLAIDLVGDDRTIDLHDNLTVTGNSYIDQDIRKTASPKWAEVGILDSGGNYLYITSASGAFPGDMYLTLDVNNGDRTIDLATNVKFATNYFNVCSTKTPSSATDTGTTGDIAWDSNYIYVCTATNTWKRTALSTW